VLQQNDALVIMQERGPPAAEGMPAVEGIRAALKGLPPLRSAEAMQVSSRRVHTMGGCQATQKSLSAR
jgi:hypothetical protein